MHAVPAGFFQGDVFYPELPRVRQMYAEGPALADGEVLHRDAADVLEQDDAVRAEGGICFRGEAEAITVEAGGIRQGRPDAPFDGDIGVAGLISRRGPGVQGDDMFVAYHAGVAVRLETDLGGRVGAELMTGFQDQRSVEIVGLSARGDVQRALRVERGLHGLRPDIGRHLPGLRLAGGVRPLFVPRFLTDERLEVRKLLGGEYGRLFGRREIP